MARRRQMRIDPSVFLQQQGGDEKTQMAMAMEMLGFGQGEGRARGELQLGREQLEETARTHGRGQDIEEQRLKAEIDRTSAQEAFNNWVKGQEIIRQGEERKYRADQLTSERQKSIDATNAKLIEFAAPEDRAGLMAEMSPDAQRYELKKQALLQNTAAKNLLPQVQEAYKKGDVDLIKKLAAANPEISQRPEFEWEKWNQGMPAPKVGLAELARTTSAPEAPVRSEAPLAWLLDKIRTTPLPGSREGAEALQNVVGLERRMPPVNAMVPSPAVFGDVTRPELKVEDLMKLVAPPEAPVSAVGQGGAWQHQIPQATQFQRPEEAVYSFPPQISAVQPGEYAPGAEFPRQPVTGPTPTPQWTVQDLLSKLMTDRSEQERLPWTFGPWNPPTGGGMPSPVGGVEIDPRLLGQPRRYGVGE